MDIQGPNGVTWKRSSTAINELNNDTLRRATHAPREQALYHLVQADQASTHEEDEAEARERVRSNKQPRLMREQLLRRTRTANQVQSAE